MTSLWFVYLGTRLFLFRKSTRCHSQKRTRRGRIARTNDTLPSTGRFSPQQVWTDSQHRLPVEHGIAIHPGRVVGEPPKLAKRTRILCLVARPGPSFLPVPPRDGILSQPQAQAPRRPNRVDRSGGSKTSQRQGPLYPPYTPGRPGSTGTSPTPKVRHKAQKRYLSSLPSKILAKKLH